MDSGRPAKLSWRNFLTLDHAVDGCTVNHRYRYAVLVTAFGQRDVEMFVVSACFLQPLALDADLVGHRQQFLGRVGDHVHIFMRPSGACMLST